MPEWKDSYPDKIGYQKNVFNILSPAYINFCLAMAGWEVVDLARPFTFMDLGAGYGISTTAWAAQYPHAKFHTLDFNPLHCTLTSKLKTEAELDNLSVHQASIADALDMDLPQFDFVVMHGVYSWVSDAAREDIHAFLAKFLKPGGAAYIGYNAMPGSGQVDPMRVLIHEHVRHENPGTEAARSHIETMQNGFTLLNELRELDAGFFAHSPLAVSKLDSWLQDKDPEYLVGEIMPAQYRAFYFPDMCDRLGSGGLTWACSLDAGQFLDGSRLPEASRKFLEKRKNDPLWRETLTDFLTNRAFRNDVFIKGNQRPTVSMNMDALEDMRFCWAHVFQPLPEEVVKNGLRLGLRKEIYAPLQSAMTDAPVSLSELAVLIGMMPRHLLQALVIPLFLDWVHPALPEDSEEVSARVRRYNIALKNAMGDKATMPVLSAASAWVKHRDPLSCHYILAAMQGADIEAYIVNVLENDPDGEEQKAELAKKGLSLAQAVRRYLQSSVGSMDSFLVRHRLAGTPEEQQPV